MAPVGRRRRHRHYVPARINADACPVDTGDGHRVRSARSVPNVGHVAAATGPTRIVPTRPGSRRSSDAGPVQGGDRRRRSGVQRPFDRHHQTNRSVRGVQRARLHVQHLRRRRLGIRIRCHLRPITVRRHHIRDHTHVQATRTGG